MADRAHVTSTEAIDQFKGNLVVYVSKAKLLLENACDEVFRMRTWLQSEQRMFWENQVRRRQKILENAQQALFSAGMAKLREPTAAERTAVSRAKRALTEAEDKLRLVKQWSREFDNRIEPQVRQLETLRTMLSNDMPKAVAHLVQVIRALEAYAGVAPPIASGAVEPLEAEPAGEGGDGDTATSQPSPLPPS
jgi:hypothetical protein